MDKSRVEGIIGFCMEDFLWLANGRVWTEIFHIGWYYVFENFGWMILWILY